jgi:hypothetical protein
VRRGAPAMPAGRTGPALPGGPRYRLPADRLLRSIGLYLAPKFSMISPMCTIEPLRIANELLDSSRSNKRLFGLSPTGETA